MITRFRERPLKPKGLAMPSDGFQSIRKLVNYGQVTDFAKYFSCESGPLVPLKTGDRSGML
jgi:hypothetical protein